MSKILHLGIKKIVLFAFSSLSRIFDLRSKIGCILEMKIN